MDIEEIKSSMQSAKEYAEEAIDNIDSLDIDKKLSEYNNVEIFDEFVKRAKSILIRVDTI